VEPGGVEEPEVVRCWETRRAAEGEELVAVSRHRGRLEEAKTGGKEEGGGREDGEARM
jgi:hypothetical protein